MAEMRKSCLVRLKCLDGERVTGLHTTSRLLFVSQPQNGGLYTAAYVVRVSWYSGGAVVTGPISRQQWPCLPYRRRCRSQDVLNSVFSEIVCISVAERSYRGWFHHPPVRTHALFRCTCDTCCRRRISHEPLVLLLALLSGRG